VLFGEQPVLLAGLGSVYFIRYFGAFQMDEETLQQAEDYGRVRSAWSRPWRRATSSSAGSRWREADADGLQRTAPRAVPQPVRPGRGGWLARSRAATWAGRNRRPLAERLLETDPLSANSHVAIALHHVYEAGSTPRSSRPYGFPDRSREHRVRFAYFLSSMYARQAAEVVPMLERGAGGRPAHLAGALHGRARRTTGEENPPVGSGPRGGLDGSLGGSHGVPVMYAMLGKTTKRSDG